MLIIILLYFIFITTCRFMAVEKMSLLNGCFENTENNEYRKQQNMFRETGQFMECMIDHLGNHPQRWIISVHCSITKAAIIWQNEDGRRYLACLPISASVTYKKKAFWLQCDTVMLAQGTSIWLSWFTIMNTIIDALNFFMFSHISIKPG